MKPRNQTLNETPKPKFGFLHPVNGLSGISHLIFLR